MKNRDKITRTGFVVDESFNYFIQLLVTSTFLGYILSAVGVSEALQGVINTITTVCMSAQLLAPLFGGRRVKRIVTVGMLISHLSFAVIYLLPISAIPKGATPVILVILLVIGNAVNNAVQPSRLLWFMAFIDDDKLGRFTAMKEIVSLIGGIVISLGFGVIADTFRMENGDPKPEYYLICFAALLLMTVVNTVSLVISDEKEPAPLQKDSNKSEFISVIRNPVVLKIVGLDFLWYFAVTFSTAFYPSYLREDLGFTFTVITLFSIVCLISRIIASPIMGKIADKYSFKTSLTVAIAFEAVAFLGVIFTAPGDMKWAYLVCAVFSGFAMAGVNSGLLNIVYAYVSAEQRATAIGIKSAVGGFIGLLASVLSGVVLASIQANGGVKIFGMHFYAQQIQSAVSFVVVSLAIVYICTVMRSLKRVL